MQLLIISTLLSSKHALTYTTISPPQLPRPISSLVVHLWQVFQPISAALPPVLHFVGSSDDDEDDALAPPGDLPGAGVLAIPPAPDERAPPVAPAPPVVFPVALAPPAVADPVTLEDDIPTDLPQVASLCFGADTCNSSLLPPGVPQLLSTPGPPSMELGDLWAYFAQVYNVTLPQAPFLPTFQDFLQGLSASGVAVVPYPGQAALRARDLICRTFRSQVDSALPNFSAGLAYRVPMLVSLEVNFSGEREFV